MGGWQPTDLGDSCGPEQAHKGWLRLSEGNPRNGQRIVIAMERPRDGPQEPISYDYAIVRYVPAEFTNSRYGPMVWRDDYEDGMAIAENLPVAWKPLEEVGGFDVA